MTKPEPMPIRKLVVANRGEVARRVFATCRRMGIATVAVYSDPDISEPFVTEADEAVALGGETPTESYLRGADIIAAARRAGADAIHPGYGFLSESADFARAVIDAGLTWVGPPPESIAIMGSKLEAKRLMEEADVPTLPGVDTTGMDDTAVTRHADEIGYPILVKASAGGGGKGMRVVVTPSELTEAVAGARREAGSAFGDDTVFLEKYLDAPRHIEIQIMADSSGNTISLFERECSIQRRHQKIIEEAPSVAIDDVTRRAMSEAAVAAARSVDYVGAGTVEFLFDDGDFYFLEMNTRLQVEHPVTEMVTGLDLVRLQLLIAAGHPLPPELGSLTIQGHAIEARLYAEDPEQGFLPVTGTIDHFSFPPDVRVDSGVETGSKVTIHYDPMLAKVVSWAPTRAEAAGILARALQQAKIHGSVTNRNLLVRVLRHPDFLAGEIDTAFLERHSPAELGRPLVDAEGERRAAVAAAIAAQAERRRAAGVLASLPSGWRNVPSQLQTVNFEGPGGEVTVSYGFDRGRLTVEGFSSCRLVAADPQRVGVELDGVLGWYHVHRRGEVSHVDGPDGPVSLIEKPRFPSIDAGEVPGSLQAPMPGKVIRVDASEGDHVEEGQVLVVMEAMKMEHTLRAPHSGRVVNVHATAGEQVAAGSVLVVVGET